MIIEKLALNFMQAVHEVTSRIEGNWTLFSIITEFGDIRVAVKDDLQDDYVCDVTDKAKDHGDFHVTIRKVKIVPCIVLQELIVARALGECLIRFCVNGMDKQILSDRTTKRLSRIIAGYYANENMSSLTIQTHLVDDMWKDRYSKVHRLLLHSDKKALKSRIDAVSDFCDFENEKICMNWRKHIPKSPNLWEGTCNNGFHTNVLKTICYALGLESDDMQKLVPFFVDIKKQEKVYWAPEAIREFIRSVKK